MDWDKEKQVKVFPDGTYKVVIEKQERCTASTGTPQIRWYAKILEPSEFKGKSFCIHTPLTEKSLWKVASLVDGCGLTDLPPIDTESELFAKITATCVGRTAYWRNAKSTYEGSERNEIVNFSQDTDQNLITVSLKDDTPEFAR